MKDTTEAKKLRGWGEQGGQTGGFQMTPQSRGEQEELEGGGIVSMEPYAFDECDMGALLAMARVMKKGGEKPGRGKGNWMKVPCDEHINRALIHLMKAMRGDSDEDHLAHAMCRCMMAHATKVYTVDIGE